MTNERAVKSCDTCKHDEPFGCPSFIHDRCENYSEWEQADGEYITQSAGDEIRQKNYDLISRQAVMNCFKKWQPYMATRLWDFEKELSALPSVKQEPKTGHWIWQTEDIYQCSECGEDIHVKEVMNKPQYAWCPICGSPMEIER